MTIEQLNEGNRLQDEIKHCMNYIDSLLDDKIDELYISATFDNGDGDVLFDISSELNQVIINYLTERKTKLKLEFDKL
jgi:hypothetical protein